MRAETGDRKMTVLGEVLGPLGESTPRGSRKKENVVIYLRKEGTIVHVI